MGLGTGGDCDKQDCLGLLGFSCEAVSIQVKDMVLKENIEHNRAKDQEILEKMQQN